MSSCEQLSPLCMIVIAVFIQFLNQLPIRSLDLSCCVTCVCVSDVKIILAFGNYMNSSKRGAAYGFRLQSLDLVSKTSQCFLCNASDVIVPFVSDCFLFALRSCWTPNPRTGSRRCCTSSSASSRRNIPRSAPSTQSCTSWTKRRWVSS